MYLTIQELYNGTNMAYFAQVENNIVQQVISINNSVIGEPELSFPETEPIGQEFISSTLKFSGTWLQTSYNSNYRKHYAGVGYSYDATLDAFIPPQPFTSWILDITTCVWEAPVPYPNDGHRYYWDEDTLSWVRVDDV